MSTGAFRQKRFRTEIIKEALLKQMELVEKKLREGKVSLEQAMSQDLDTTGFTTALEGANSEFKEQLRHVTMHLPKAGRGGKAKAKAEPKAAA